MKLLHLNLKRKWFDMILSGEKKEEYRELTEYWSSRLKYNYQTICFSNGYSKERDQFYADIEEIKVDTGNTEWGAEPLKKYFVIKLINIRNNYDD